MTLDIRQLRAPYLPAFSDPPTIETEDVPLRFKWDQPDWDPVNSDGIETVTKYVREHVRAIAPEAAAQIQQLSRPSVRKLVASKYNRLADAFNQRELVAALDKKRTRQLNSDDSDGHPSDAMQIDSDKERKAEKVVDGREKANLRSSIQRKKKAVRVPKPGIQRERSHPVLAGAGATTESAQATASQRRDTGQRIRRRLRLAASVTVGDQSIRRRRVCRKGAPLGERQGTQESEHRSEC